MCARGAYRALPRGPSTFPLEVALRELVTLSPNRTLLASFGVVAASTIALPSVGGYGTVLFQVVVLNAWAIVAAATSQFYADHHHAPVWILALVLNVALYAIPATLIWGLTRTKWPRASTWLMLCWCVFYLASLFVIFRATDGP